MQAMEQLTSKCKRPTALGNGSSTLHTVHLLPNYAKEEQKVVTVDDRTGGSKE
jgi:hypothetical protein